MKKNDLKKLKDFAKNPVKVGKTDEVVEVIQNVDKYQAQAIELVKIQSNHQQSTSMLTKRKKNRQGSHDENEVSDHSSDRESNRIDIGEYFKLERSKTHASNRKFLHPSIF